MIEQEKAKNNGSELVDEETLSLLSEIHQAPNLTQREISLRLNVSLGKTNYLLNALVEKGLLKMRSFSRKGRKAKMKGVKYILTKKGFQEKLKLTYHFLKKKEAEYNQLLQAWQQLNGSAQGEETGEHS